MLKNNNRRSKVIKSNYKNKANINNNRKRSLLFYAVMGLVMFGIAVAMTITILSFFNKPKEKSNSLDHIQRQNIDIKPVSKESRDNHKVDSKDKPKYISINSIGLKKARVTELGLLAPSNNGSQQMDVPKNIHDTGWFNCQINPIANNRCDKYTSTNYEASDSAAIIDGHSCDGKGCVFDHLDKLKPDEKIDIELGSGKKISYRINHVEIVNLHSLDMNKVLSPYQKGHAGLNLITCLGAWTTRDSRGSISTNQRVVVYSTVIE